jgi:hypothetical protein
MKKYAQGGTPGPKKSKISSFSIIENEEKLKENEKFLSLNN